MKYSVWLAVQTLVAVVGLLVACTLTMEASVPDPLPPPAVCSPTGWVDRMEAGLVVVNPDQGEEERIYPVSCFADFPREGTRVVDGQVDWAETERMRRKIRRLVQKMVQRGKASQE